MRILMLSWEYPPKGVGGLANHVYYLSGALSKLGHEIHIITLGDEGTLAYENDRGVFVHRVIPYKIETEDFIKWVMQLNFAMLEEGIRLINREVKFDIIHAHDWLVAYAGRSLKLSYDIPLLSTIHATEFGRNNGINTAMQRYIASTEGMLVSESCRVVVCSNFMGDQVKAVLEAQLEKIRVIPNGIQMDLFKFHDGLQQFRRKYASDDEKIVFCIGRHVFEKGIHLLIDAIPRIIEEYSSIKFIIAGTGPMSEDFKIKVKNMGLQNRVLFPGYMGEETKNKLYMVSDVSVFPSLYEPFGIVALEAMAAGCPVVVSDTGGLAEIVSHKLCGMKCIPGSSNSIGDNILSILFDDILSANISNNALIKAENEYSWDQIAKLTSKMYEEVKDELQ